MSDDKNLKLVVKETAAPELIPVGVYQAYFSDFEQAEGEYGAYLKLNFVITEGEHRDTLRSTIAKMKLSKGKKSSKLYQILTAINNGELSSNSEINMSDYLGKACKILVKNKPGDEEGWQIISEVMPA
jgi:hypothetical protein